MPHSRLAFALVVAALGGGCVTEPPYNPFTLPEPEFTTRIHTIAVAPATIAASIALQAPERERIEALVLSRLAAHGFTTVPPAEVQAIREGHARRLGGPFDPVTGRSDEAKLDQIRLETLRELAERFHTDALLYPIVVVVTAKFSNGRATWCGTQQDITTPTDNTIVWLLRRNQVSQSSGSIPASCLYAVIDETSGLEIYKGMGGIELIQTFDGSGFTARPEAELFADPERLEASVRLAIGALPGNPEAQGQR